MDKIMATLKYKGRVAISPTYSINDKIPLYCYMKNVNWEFLVKFYHKYDKIMVIFSKPLSSNTWAKACNFNNEKDLISHLRYNSNCQNFLLAYKNNDMTLYYDIEPFLEDWFHVLISI